MPIALDSLGSFVGVGMTAGGYLDNLQYPAQFINQPEFKLMETPIKLQASYIKAFNKRSILSAGAGVGIVERLVLSDSYERQFDPVTQELLPVDFSKAAYYKAGTTLSGGISFVQKIHQKSSLGLGAAVSSEALQYYPSNSSSRADYYQNYSFYWNNDIYLSDKFSLKPAIIYSFTGFETLKYPTYWSYIPSSFNFSLGLKYNFNNETSLSLQPAFLLGSYYYYYTSYPNTFCTGLYFQTKQFAVGATYMFPDELNPDLKTKYPSFGLNAQFHIYNAKPTIGFEPF